MSSQEVQEEITERELVALVNALETANLALVHKLKKLLIEIRKVHKNIATITKSKGCTIEGFTNDLSMFSHIDFTSIEQIIENNFSRTIRQPHSNTEDFALNQIYTTQTVTEPDSRQHSQTHDIYTKECETNIMNPQVVTREKVHISTSSGMFKCTANQTNSLSSFEERNRKGQKRKIETNDDYTTVTAKKSKVIKTSISNTMPK